MEDPKIDNFKVQLTKVREYATSRPAEPSSDELWDISDQLLNVEDEIRTMTGRKILGESRKKMPFWTDSLKNRLHNLGPQISLNGGFDPLSRTDQS